MTGSGDFSKIKAKNICLVMDRTMENIKTLDGGVNNSQCVINREYIKLYEKNDPTPDDAPFLTMVRIQAETTIDYGDGTRAITLDRFEKMGGMMLDDKLDTEAANSVVAHSSIPNETWTLQPYLTFHQATAARRSLSVPTEWIKALVDFRLIRMVRKVGTTERLPLLVIMVSNKMTKKA